MHTLFTRFETSTVQDYFSEGAKLMLKGASTNHVIKMYIIVLSLQYVPALNVVLMWSSRS